MSAETFVALGEDFPEWRDSVRGVCASRHQPDLIDVSIVRVLAGPGEYVYRRGE